MSKFVYIIHQPHPLSPPLLTRRGGRDFIREALPLFDSPQHLFLTRRGERDFIREALPLFDSPQHLFLLRRGGRISFEGVSPLQFAPIN